MEAFNRNRAMTFQIRSISKSFKRNADQYLLSFISKVSIYIHVNANVIAHKTDCKLNTDTNKM